MADLTLAIDDQVLSEATKLAIDRNTTINQMVREFLEGQIRQASRGSQAKARLLRAQFATKPISWSRDELHER